MRSLTAVTALTLVLLLLAGVPSAQAAQGYGDVTVSVGGRGSAAKALRAGGVRVRPIAPAKRRAGRLRLPVARLTVGGSATTALRGGLRFASTGGEVGLRSLRLVLSVHRATISAKVGKRRHPLFAAALTKRTAKLDRDAGSAHITGARLVLTRRGAALLRARLGLERLPARPLGRLTVDAYRGTAPGRGPDGGPTGDGPPKSGPLSNEPPVLARPATAVDAGNVAISWYPRDSFVRYLASATGPQDGSFATGGATKGAPMGTGSHPCSDVSYPGSGDFDYRFDYAPKSGWYDPVSGTAALYGSGTVRFRWQSHTIDLTASDPEIEINGSASRAIFRFGGSTYSNQRAPLVSLDLAGQPTSSGGGSFAYTAMRGQLTEDGEAVFASFYPAGDWFGCVSVSFTTP
jgi:Htaa